MPAASDIAVSVRRLSKDYTIGHRGGDRPATLAEAALARLRNPFRREATETFHALADVSFDIPRGAVVGIIGRNGAGKSTLLKILSRITEPTAGTVDLYGRVGSLLEVGTGFHPELTGRENVFLNGAILGMSKGEIRKQFDAIVDFAGVERFLDTPVKRYSSGMYVRLAFAVAAHLRSEILIIDEVLAVGDAAFQQKCLGEIRATSGGGRTVLFVSHSMAAVESLCSSVMLLEAGRVRYTGSTSEGIRRYSADPQAAATFDFAVVNSSRTGTGAARFTGCHILSDGVDGAGDVRSGQQVTFALSYAAAASGDLGSVRAGVAVSDLSGRPFLLCSTEFSDADLTAAPRRGILRCTIPELPLSEGTYRLTLFLEFGHDVADCIQDGPALHVIDGDFYGTGRNYPDGWKGKVVLAHHAWSLDAVDDRADLPAITGAA